MTTSSPLLAQLSEYLASQRERITQQWLDAVLKDTAIEASNLLTHKQLLDRLPDLFDKLCRFLRGRDAALLTGPAQEEARAHGHQRWEQGYAIDEVLRELHLLRRIVLSESITAFAATNENFGRPAETTARNLVEDFFSSAIADAVGQFLGEQQEHVAGYARQLEEMNRQLEINNGRLTELDASRVQLTRSVAYKLRTFLHAFSAALAATRKPGDEPALAAAQGNVDDMAQLIDQLVEYSAVLSHASAPAVDQFDLEPLLDELIGAFSAMARAKGLDLKSELDARLIAVSSDRRKVKQIVSNLLSTALKQTEGGAVLLSFLMVDENRWAIAVSHTGAGVAPTDQEGVFEERERGFAAAGSGMGLAIAKEIAAQLGGVVRAISWTGSGGRFEVVLPVRFTAV
jgi:signal transduction histidine kinase